MPKIDLNNRTILVTGASGGIGLAILIFLAERKKHSVGQRKDREAVQ